MCHTFEKFCVIPFESLYVKESDNNKCFYYDIMARTL